MKRNLVVLLFIFLSTVAICQKNREDHHGNSPATVESKLSFKALLDKEFDKGSNIFSLTLTPFTIEALATLGKVWGFLKYYHPAVAKGDYNWDYELFRIMPKVLKSKTKREVNKIILEWIDRLPRVERGNYQAIDSSLVKPKPDYSWINEAQIGQKLASRLNLIKEAKRSSQHYYIAFDSLPNAPRPTFTNESAYADMAYPDAGYRLLSLFRYWNIIQYFFPYRYLTDENWNQVLKDFIPKFVKASSGLEYTLVVLELITSIDDTHAQMWSSKTIETFKGNYFAPLEVTFIENHAVVTGYLDQALGIKTGLQKGDVIQAVNAQKVTSLIQKRLPYTPASNDASKLREIAWDLLRTNDTLMRITFLRDTIRETVTVKCVPRDQIDVYQRIQREDTCFKMLTSDIAYLYPWTLKAEYISVIMKKVATTKGLVIDSRFTSREPLEPLGEYLFAKPTTFATFTKGDLTFPGLFTVFMDVGIGKANEKPYQGKIVILNNEQTQSSAEFSTMALRSAPNSIIIGSTTSGADGTVTDIVLPGGIQSSFTGIGVYYPDGRETQRIGIIPDIEIRPTIKGIKEDRDELLEKAIEVINN